MYIGLDDYLEKHFKKNTPRSYPNLTQNFIRIFTQGIKQSSDIFDDFSGNIMIMGLGGSGKTGMSCNLLNLILGLSLKYHKRWTCGLYRTPDKLLNSIQESCPKEMAELFSNIYNIEKVEPYQVILIDEAIMQLNNMRFKEQYAQTFLEKITYSRHKNNFYILNSLDDGVFYRLRTKVHVIIYKLMNRFLIESSNFHDSFAKNNVEILTKLNPRQSLIDASTWKYLPAQRRIGFLAMHVGNYCPWFTKDISQSMSDESDVRFKIKMQQDLIIQDKIQEVIQKYPDEIQEKGGSTFLKGYIQRSDKKFYEENKSSMQEIYQQAYYLLKINAVNTEIKETQFFNQFKKDWLFPDYLKANIPDHDEAEVLYHYNCGLSQEEIGKKIGKSKPWVNHVINQYKVNKKLGIYFEKYWCSLHDGESTAGNENKPDFIDIKGKFKEKDYAHSLKYRTIIADQIKFNVLEDFLPEYKYSLTKEFKHFYVVLFNPKWNYSTILVKRINIDSLNEVFFNKRDFRFSQEQMQEGKLQIITDFEM